MGSPTQELHRLYSLRTAAQRLDCSVKTLQRAIALGTLRAVRIGRHWHVSEAEAEVRRVVERGLVTD